MGEVLAERIPKPVGTMLCWYCGLASACGVSLGAWCFLKQFLCVFAGLWGCIARLLTDAFISDAASLNGGRLT
jgi:hypothetical protein